MNSPEELQKINVIVLDKFSGWAYYKHLNTIEKLIACENSRRKLILDIYTSSDTPDESCVDITYTVRSLDGYRRRESENWGIRETVAATT